MKLWSLLVDGGHLNTKLMIYLIFFICSHYLDEISLILIIEWYFNDNDWMSQQSVWS